jgi:hypothetical protein
MEEAGRERKLLGILDGRVVTLDPLSLSLRLEELLDAGAGAGAGASDTREREAEGRERLEEENVEGVAGVPLGG